MRSVDFYRLAISAIVSLTVATAAPVTSAQAAPDLSSAKSTTVLQSAVQLAQGTPKAPETKKDSKSPAAPVQPGTPPAAAPPAQQPPKSTWAVNCTNRQEGKLECEMALQLVENGTNKQIVLITVRPTPGENAQAMIFRFLHGVYLPSGLTVRVDAGKPTPLPFQKSDQYGVYAALPLSEQIVTEMKGGAELKLTAELNKGQPLELTLPLADFAAAYDKIKSLQ